MRSRSPPTPHFLVLRVRVSVRLRGCQSTSATVAAPYLCKPQTINPHFQDLPFSCLYHYLRNATKNMELALEWLESNRAVMDEEHINMGWFLRFQNGSVYDMKRTPPPGTVRACVAHECAWCVRCPLPLSLEIA